VKSLLVGVRMTRRQFSMFESCARSARSICGALAHRCGIVWTVALALLICFSGSRSVAEEASKQQMQSLDEQVQEIKSDVLGIAAELSNLEERLLYPSNTQVAVFVSLAEGETLQLDSVQVEIDGKLVAQHIYSFKELEALQKGGVQRIYTGNIPTGEHRLDVAVAGVLPSSGDFSESQSFTFSKDVEPKLVGLTLGGSGSPSIELGGW
jgi:hypothetical protein